MMKIPRILTETVISKLKSSDKGIVIYDAAYFFPSIASVATTEELSIL